MKHPKYRVSDVLYMDSEALVEIIEYVRAGVDLLKFDAHPLLRGVRPKIEMVGSYTFGCARLRSDVDFNLAFPDWNLQVTARRMFYSTIFRKEFSNYLLNFQQKTGLKIDCGCVDAETDAYNIFLDCDTMFLHRRGSHDVDIFNSGDIDEIIYKPANYPPINVLEFRQGIDIQPPISKIHLKLDNYAFRWMATQNIFKDRPSEWLEDEWKSEVDFWKEKYSNFYTGYHESGGKLVED